MPNTVILFDFDGTLFYGTAEINYYAINLALADLSLPPITREIANTTVGDKLYDLCVRILQTNDSARCQQLLDRIICHTEEAITMGAVAEPDCIKMLESLSRQVPLAICSNAEKAYLDSLTQKLGIAPYFSAVWHCHPGKTKAEGIAYLRTVLQADRVIMVGDRAEDVVSGKQNGCITVAIQNDFGARDATDADYRVDTHAELEQILHALLKV